MERGVADIEPRKKEKKSWKAQKNSAKIMPKQSILSVIKKKRLNINERNPIHTYEPPF